MNLEPLVRTEESASKNNELWQKDSGTCLVGLPQAKSGPIQRNSVLVRTEQKLPTKAGIHVSILLCSRNKGLSGQEGPLSSRTPISALVTGKVEPPQPPGRSIVRVMTNPTPVEADSGGQQREEWASVASQSLSRTQGDDLTAEKPTEPSLTQRAKSAPQVPGQASSAHHPGRDSANAASLLRSSGPKGTTWAEPPGITGQTQTEKLQNHWPVIFKAINIKQRMRKYSRWKARYGVYDPDLSAMKADIIGTTGGNRMGKGIGSALQNSFVS